MTTTTRTLADAGGLGASFGPLSPSGPHRARPAEEDPEDPTLRDLDAEQRLGGSLHSMRKPSHLPSRPALPRNVSHSSRLGGRPAGLGPRSASATQIPAALTPRRHVAGTGAPASAAPRASPNQPQPSPAGEFGARGAMSVGGSEPTPPASPHRRYAPGDRAPLSPPASVRIGQVDTPDVLSQATDIAQTEGSDCATVPRASLRSGGPASPAWRGQPRAATQSWRDMMGTAPPGLAPPPIRQLSTSGMSSQPSRVFTGGNPGATPQREDAKPSAKSPSAKSPSAMARSQTFRRMATQGLARKQVCVVVAVMDGADAADASQRADATQGALATMEAASGDFLRAVFGEVRRAGGAVHSFDATRVAATFGAASEHRDAASAAARCAMLAQRAGSRARRRWLADVAGEVYVSCVLEECVVGNVGTADLLAFQVSGVAMDLARDVVAHAPRLRSRVTLNDKASDRVRSFIRLHRVDAGAEWAAGRWHRTALFEATGAAEPLVPARWQRGQLLGEGSFGSVYHCLRPDGSFFAMKVVDIAGSGVASDDVVGLMREVRLMSELDHPHVVRYLGCTYEAADQELRIFMEYVDGGSLAALVERLPEPLNEDAARTYTAHVASGVAYLHGRGIMHRDLKGGNVLLSTRGEAKLADFGTSKSMQQTEQGGETVLVRHISTIRLPSKSAVAKAKQRRMTYTGTVLWMAPEVHRMALKQSEESYSFAADVWSVGCCLCEMLNRGEAPWHGFGGNIDATVTIAHWDRDLPNNAPDLTELSPECVSFLRACLRPDPDQRPSAAELERHAWLTRRDAAMEAAPQQELAEIEEAMREDQKEAQATPAGFAFNDLPF